TLIGRDGQVQVPVKDGRVPSLNHIGYEMESERQLANAYERAIAAGVSVNRTVDHTIARSVYLFDPDKFYLEFYADTQEDWASAVTPGTNQPLLTGNWTPDAST